MDKPQNTKLFLNLDPDIVLDPEFRSGITVEKLEKKEINYGDIIFEAAESWAVSDIELFKSALKKYRGQGYGVAVSNVCSGYSGINRILDIDPQYIKIDAEMIRDIEKDEMKRSFVSALAQFAGDLGIPLIAQGVESYNAQQYSVLLVQGVLREERHKILRYSLPEALTRKSAHKRRS